MCPTRDSVVQPAPSGKHAFVLQVVPDICLPMVAPGKALDEMIINRDNNMNSVRILSYVPKDGLAPS